MSIWPSTISCVSCHRFYRRLTLLQSTFGRAIHLQGYFPRLPVFRPDFAASPVASYHITTRGSFAASENNINDNNNNSSNSDLRLPYRRSCYRSYNMSANDGLSKASKKLVPADPVACMVIRDITPNLTTLSVPFLRFGTIKFGGRATLVKLQTGNVAVFSPVALTPEAKAKVSSLGTLKYIVAPDIEHHIFVTPWAKEYPEATVIGMEGLPEKREADPSTKGSKFGVLFTAGNKRELKISEEFDAEFDTEYFHSHGNKELVFCHRPTKTLIEADLLFNLPATEQYSKTNESATTGFFTKLFSTMTNTKGDMIGQRRFLWYGPGAADRAAFKESSELVMQWDFDRIVPCHGDVIETGGKDIFAKLTVWFREGKK